MHALPLCVSTTAVLLACCITQFTVQCHGLQDALNNPEAAGVAKQDSGTKKVVPSAPEKGCAEKKVS